MAGRRPVTIWETVLLIVLYLLPVLNPKSYDGVLIVLYCIVLYCICHNTTYCIFKPIAPVLNPMSYDAARRYKARAVLC